MKDLTRYGNRSLEKEVQFLSIPTHSVRTENFSLLIIEGATECPVDEPITDSVHW